MSWNEGEEDVEYSVVRNHEEQYSIWPRDRDLPGGWSAVGVTGKKQDCLDYIDKVWVDMRPLSLRKKMEELAQRPLPPGAAEPAAPEKTLVERLTEGRHEVVARANPAGDASALEECLDRRYLYVLFPHTRGGTELGVRVDPEKTELREGSFASAAGKLHLEGTLMLDGVPLRCVADIDLRDLKGLGHLERAS